VDRRRLEPSHAQAAGGNPELGREFRRHGDAEDWAMKGIALWALGIPIPVIILLYLFHVL
jgi:hypothetical protein